MHISTQRREGGGGKNSEPQPPEGLGISSSCNVHRYRSVLGMDPPPQKKKNPSLRKAENPKKVLRGHTVVWAQRRQQLRTNAARLSSLPAFPPPHPGRVLLPTSLSFRSRTGTAGASPGSEGVRRGGESPYRSPGNPQPGYRQPPAGRCRGKPGTLRPFPAPVAWGGHIRAKRMSPTREL